MRDRRGVAAFVFALSGTALISMMGFATDVGVVFVAQQALQSNTNAAALDGAYVWGTSGNQTTAQSAATGWITTHPVPFASGVSATATPVCIKTDGTAGSTTGIPTCPNGGNNAMKLTQTATVPTYFLKMLGVNSWNITAAATAVPAGGVPRPLNIMFVLDTTGSMNTADKNCTVPGVSNPTKLQCAKYGVQLILKQLDPTVDMVGVMVFPGMGSVWRSCSSTEPAAVLYGSTGIVYQLVSNTALETSYSTGIGQLNDNDPLIKMIGDNSNSVVGCLGTLGGRNTFYADALGAAQTALSNEGVANGTNVIILLSDGESNALSTDLSTTYNSTACSPSTVCNPSHLEQQCNQAVYNAQTSAAAGAWVYAIAYDSTLTLAGQNNTNRWCMTQKVGSTYYYDSPSGSSTSAWSPCAALQSIASTPSKFFSATSGTTTSNCIVNNYANVETAFQQVGYSLLKPRLVVTN